MDSKCELLDSKCVFKLNMGMGSGSVSVDSNWIWVDSRARNNHINNMGSLFDIRFWDIFIEAMNVAEGNTFTAAFEEAFDRSLIYENSGLASTTMVLFYARPNLFMSLDSNSRLYISSKYGNESSVSNGQEYVALLKWMHSEPGRTIDEQSLVEISLSAHQYEEFEEPEGEWWPSLDEYNPHITAEMWSEMLANERIFTENSKIVMKRLLDHDDKQPVRSLHMYMVLPRISTIITRHPWLSVSRILQSGVVTISKIENGYGLLYEPNDKSLSFKRITILIKRDRVLATFDALEEYLNDPFRGASDFPVAFFDQDSELLDYDQ